MENSILNQPGGQQSINNAPAQSAYKNKSSGIVILSILSVLLACATGCFAYLYFSNASQTTKAETAVSDSKQDENEVTPSEESEESDAKTISLAFDESKIQNPTEGMTYVQGMNCEQKSDVWVRDAGICIDIDDNNPKNVHVRVIGDSVNDYYKTLLSNTDTSNYDVSLSQDVKSVYIAGEGQSIGYEVILYLLEDGTVAYTPIANALQNSNFQSAGILEGVTDAAKFYMVSQTGVPFSGGIRTVYQNSKGEIYLLTLDSYDGYYGIAK